MNFWIYLSVYLFLGIFFVFVGPLAEQLKKQFKALDVSKEIQKKHTKRKFRRAKIGIRIMSILLFPFFLTVSLYSYYQFKKTYYSNENNCSDEDYNKLYFSHLSGQGIIVCQECGYIEKIISHAYSKEKSDWYKSFFQCQQCGIFYEKEFQFDDSTQKMICDNCGGIIEHNSPIFCPKCRSKNVKYLPEKISYYSDIN